MSRLNLSKIVLHLRVNWLATYTVHSVTDEIIIMMIYILIPVSLAPAVHLRVAA